jgi:Flp pilus assembly protein TadG
MKLFNKNKCSMPSFLRNVGNDESGATAIEFGLVTPIFLTILFATFDFSHTLWAQAQLEGAVEKASRDSTIEMGATVAAETARQGQIDSVIEQKMLNIAGNADVNIQRTYFTSFQNAANPVGEALTLDVNGNGECDTGDEYLDQNSSGTFDSDGIGAGQGSARDVARYDVTVTYPRLFPLTGFLGLPTTVTLNSRTVLTNQPFRDQRIGGAAVC